MQVAGVLPSRGIALAVGPGMRDNNSGEAPGTPGSLTPISAPFHRAPVLDSLAIAPEEPLDWRRQLSATWRYRWWIVGATALGALGGVGGVRFLPPRFQAQ